jgi:hypothetical protein
MLHEQILSGEQNAWQDKTKVSNRRSALTTPPEKPVGCRIAMAAIN